MWAFSLVQYELACNVPLADARALWLTISANTGAQLSLVTPPTSSQMPPGM